MTDVLLRSLFWVTLGLALVLLLRRRARRLLGAGTAFTLWLLPLVLALAPWLPERFATTAIMVLPGLSVSPHFAATMPPHAFAFDWTRGLMLMWLLGVALGVARLALHYFKLLRGLHATPAAWRNGLARLAADIGVDARCLRMHEAGPAVLWALPRAMILLPPDFAERFDNIAIRELVLRHEQTHLRRGDAWWSLVMELASALLWFHPLMWFARPRFRLDQELACDAAALRDLPQRTARYARALIDSVAVQPAPALIPWLAEPQLKERIAMLMRIPPTALRRRVGVLAVALLLAGGMYIAAGESSPVHAATPSSASAPMIDMTYRNAHPPRYPVAAVEQHQQGLVMLDVQIDATGAVINVTVDPRRTTAPDDLQQAAIAAVRGWKFRAGMQHGKPVGGVLKVPVNFSLPGVGGTAGQHGEHGTVMLKMHINAHGTPEQITVDQAKTQAPKDLVAVAVEAGHKWKFTPAQVAGKAKDGWIEVPVRFSQASVAPASK